MSQILQRYCLPFSQRVLAGVLAGVLALCMAGCASILAPARVELPKRYSLDSPSAPIGSAMSPMPLMPKMPARPTASGAPTLLVSMPYATVGFDSTHMMYLRQAHQLEYFARSEWVDTPARMLLPRLIDSLAASGIFGAVLPAPASARADFVLDVQLLRLQQEFLTQPSQIHLTVRVVLLDNTRHQVLAWREFDSIVKADSDTAYGGVLASQQAVQAVLTQLVAFCRDHAR